MEQAGRNGREGSPPGVIGTNTPHASAAAGQLSALRPEAAEDDSGLKPGAVSRYETSPSGASPKRALPPLHFGLLHKPLREHAADDTKCTRR